jgi:succinoglycan biosynthesis transport protein ExoP
MDSDESALKSNLQPLLRSMWQLKWALLPLGVVIAGGALHLTRKQTKIYEASAQLIIDLEAPRYLPYNGNEIVSLGSGKTWNTKEFFETQFRIIRSRGVSAVVVERLGLTRDPDFLGLTQLPPEEREERLARADAASALVGRISLLPAAESHVVSVRVRDHNPARAALIANTLTAVYREQNVGYKVSAAHEAVVWLTQKLSEVERDKERAAQALLDFKREHDLLQAGLAERQNLLGLTLQSLEQKLSDAHAHTAALRGEAAQAKRVSDEEALLSLDRVAQSSLIQRLKGQRLELENQRTALLAQYLDAHPKVKVVTEQLERLNVALRAEVRGLKQSITRALQAAEAAEGESARALSEAQGRARSLQAQELRYKALEAAVQSNTELYTQMQIRLKEAELQAQATANNVRVLEEALTPLTPISPRLSLNLAAAFVGWLVLSALMIVARNLLDRTIRDQSELLTRFNITLLGVVPRIRIGQRPTKQDEPVRNPELYVLENPTSTVAEAVRTVRTNLLFMDPQRALKSLMVTSAAPRDGKTLNSINMSVAMALAGDRVLLIDSDLRRPRVHKIFGMLNDRGFTNLLVDPSLEPEDVARPTELQNLDVLCSGPLPPNPAELLQTPAFQRVLGRLGRDYDRLVFDSPPVVPVTDAQVIGRQVDGVILVARVDQTQRDFFARAVELLSKVRVNILGVVLNDVDGRKHAYGSYYYQYGQDPTAARLSAPEEPLGERRFGGEAPRGS